MDRGPLEQRPRLRSGLEDDDQAAEDRTDGADCPILAGVAVAALVLMGWQVTSSRPSVGMDLRMVAIAGGELRVSKPGVFLGVTDVTPGRPGSAEPGGVVVANEGTEELSVQMRAHPSIRDLDKLLMVRLRVAGRPLFRGRLGELRSETARPSRWMEGSARRSRQASGCPPPLQTAIKA